MTTDRSRLPTTRAVAPVLTRAFGASVVLHLLGAVAAMYTMAGAVTMPETGWQAAMQLAAPDVPMQLRLVARAAPVPMPSPDESPLSRSEVPAAPPADLDMAAVPALAADLLTLPAATAAPRVAIGDGAPPPFAELRSLAAASRRVSVPPPAALTAAPSLPLPARIVAAAPLASDNLPPAYPVAAMQRSEQGTVEIELSLTAAGQVSAARVVQSSGCALLDQAALEALRSWRFRPATSDGGPVASTFRQRVEFYIRR